MRNTHVPTILKAVVSTRHCMKYHRFQWEIFFTEMFLREIGLNFNGKKCPFCGREYDNLLIHLARPMSRCHKRLRKLVSHILNLYTYARLNTEQKQKDRRTRNGYRMHYCRICGFEGYYYQVIYHILKEHMKKPFW